MKRRDDRKPLHLDVAARMAQKRFMVVLSDLSRRGCRIVSPIRALTIGDRVTIRPDGMESLTGTVRWSLAENAGFEFDYPLHQAVADHLCRQHPGRHAA